MRTGQRLGESVIVAAPDRGVNAAMSNPPLQGRRSCQRVAVSSGVVHTGLSESTPRYTTLRAALSIQGRNPKDPLQGEIEGSMAAGEVLHATPTRSQTVGPGTNEDGAVTLSPIPIPTAGSNRSRNSRAKDSATGAWESWL